MQNAGGHLAKDQKKKKPFIDRTLIGLFAMAAVTGAACYVLEGREAFFESFHTDLKNFLDIAPKMAGALMLSAYIQLLLPREVVARYLGVQSGARGMALAAGLGFATPGGPSTSFPVVAALHYAGTGRAPLVCYLTAWSTLGFNRILLWEMPFLGAEFALFRQLASLPLPFAAALISTLFPVAFARRRKP